MAKEDMDLDVKADSGKSSKMKTIIIIVLVALISIGIGLGAAWYFLGQQPAEAVETAESSTEEGEAAKKEVKSKEPPIYESLDPTFVVSFKDQRKARFMQLAVDVMSRDKEVTDRVREYKPMIRNRLLMIFSDQIYDEVTTSEGKEKLLQKVLDEVNNILQEQTGQAGVEGAYFTSFVAQ